MIWLESITSIHKALQLLQMENKEFSASIHQCFFCSAPLQLPSRQLSCQICSTEEGTDTAFKWQTYRYQAARLEDLPIAGYMPSKDGIASLAKCNFKLAVKK